MGRQYELMGDGIQIVTGTFDECHAHVRANLRTLSVVNDLFMRPLSSALQSTDVATLRDYLTPRPRVINIPFGKRIPQR